MKPKDLLILESIYVTKILKEESQVGGEHWGTVNNDSGNYEIFVGDVVRASNATVKPVNVAVDKFTPPQNLREPENVEKYTKTMLEGKWDWNKPVHASYWKEHDTWDSYDGNHRVAAAIEANKVHPNTVKFIPTIDVSGIIDNTIQNFNKGVKTVIGGVEIRIKKKN